MSQNKIVSLNKNMFIGLDDLEQIKLDQNEIDDLQDEALISSSLKVVNIENNLIKIIRKNTLKGLKQLEVLDLSHNLIQSIDKDAFQHSFQFSIKEIELDQNKLNSIHPFLFKGLTCLQKIMLIHNGFDNDDILELYLEKSVSFVSFNSKFAMVDYYFAGKKENVNDNHNDIDSIVKPEKKSFVCIII